MRLAWYTNELVVTTSAVLRNRSKISCLGTDNKTNMPLVSFSLIQIEKEISVTL